MFCTNCGAEIQLPAKFCSKCGVPIEEGAASDPRQAALGAPSGLPRPAQAPPQAPQGPAGAPAGPSRGMPAPPPLACASRVPVAAGGKTVYGANTLVGILGAFAVFLGMFLSCATARWEAFGYASGADSVSFIELMREAEAVFASVIVFAGIAWVVLFQMVKRPKLSLIGILGMIFGMGILVWAIAVSKSRAGGLVSISYGIGFWIYLVGMLACLAGALMKKKRQ